MKVILIVCTPFLLWILISLILRRIEDNRNNLKLEKQKVRVKLELELFKSLSKNEKVKYLKNNPSTEIKFHVENYLEKDEEVERKLVKETRTTSSRRSYSNKTYFIFDENQNIVHRYTTTEYHYKITGPPRRKTVKITPENLFNEKNTTNETEDNTETEETEVIFIDTDYIEN